ncbi:carbohydrate porin [Hyalangium versicolor]|uniref:carbohydrate porin n=1 Tax=Hyalangium versicolor TaxID=2861190 RepID=UPI001CCC708C|nr:carbohydrate porin [Hyalangium versicolor]
MKNSALIAALAATCTAGVARAELPTIDFTGYMRAGIGINARGGTQVCYGLSGADTKFRLGNECDYVVEPSFSAKLVTYEESSWHVHFMPGIYRSWGGKEFQTYTTPGGPALPDSGTDELVARFGQVYAYGTNIAVLGHGKAWAGRRYYNRLQTGINDQFLEINDGDGAGVEDMNVVIGKLSIAAMLNPRGNATSNRFTLPVRLTNIPDMPNGELAVYVTPSLQLSTEDQTTDPPTTPSDEAKGLGLGVYQTLKGVLLGGDTLVGFRWDTLGSTRNGRVVLQQSHTIGPVTIDGLAEYRVRKAASNSGNRWLAVGARADTRIVGPFRVLFEAGHDVVKPDDGSHTRNMTKFTLATAVSAGQDAGSRPTIRLFVTQAVWNQAARLSFGDSRLRQVYGNATAGTSVGLQGEAWW